MKTRTLMAALGYAGLLPFYLSALWALLAGPHHDAAARVFLIYATVILSFLGGTLWGYAVSLPSPEKLYRIGLSNAVALFAATSALLGTTLVAIVLLGLGQLSLLLYERTVGDSSGWYLALRTRLTVAALPAHLLMALYYLR